MDEKQKTSEMLRESREYDRQYWDNAFAAAKNGDVALDDALEVIAHLHASMVDNEPLSEDWRSWLNKWIELHDRVRRDREEFAAVALSPNVQPIVKPRTK